MRTQNVPKMAIKVAALLLGLGASMSTAAGQSFTPPAAATSTTTMPYSDLVQSQALAVDSSGDIFFSRPATGVLAEKPANGGAEITLYTLASGGGGYPKGVAANNTYAYITSYSGNLWQVAINGGAATDILLPCGPVDGYYLGAQEVAVDGLGNVFVAGNNETKLFEITPAGACSVVSGVTLDANSHVSADAVGNLAYSTGGVLYSLPAGAAAPVAVPGTFNSIIGLHADTSGDVFVTTYSGIVEVPFLNGALNGALAFTVLTGSSQNDIAVAANDVVYTTDGSNIFKNTLGAARYAATPVGTASAAQTVTTVFNSAQVLTGIGFAAGTAVSNDFANTGAGSCATGQSYAAGASCTLSLTFTPKSIGAREGAVVLSSAAGVLGTLAVTGQGSGAGLVLDPGTQSNLGSAYKSPSSIAVGPSGEVLVADKAAGTVTSFAAGKTTGTSIASGLGQPVAVALAADGTAYIATAAGALMQVPFNGSAYGVPTTVATGLSSPESLVVGPSGSLYVANTGAGSVLQYPSQSGSRDFATPVVISKAFKAPAGLAFDALGDLFVADSSAGSVVEIVGTTSSTVASGLASPSALAVDDSGSLYVLQSGVATILRIPFTSGSFNSNSTTALGIGLTTPTSLAADSAGNLYVADPGAPAVVVIARTAGSLNLGKLNVGASSPVQSLNLSNDGDLSLALGSPLFTPSGNTADFTVSTTGSNACASGGALATAATCSIAATFTPTATGARAETLTFSSTAVNASSITGALLGTGSNLPKTVLTLTTSPTGTVTFGSTVTAMAVVSAPAGSSPAPTGTVTFLVNGNSYKVVTLAGGSASATITGLPAGSNTINASYSGDSNYAASSGTTQTIVVTLAPTTTTFTSSISSATGSVAPSTSVTLTATVLATVTGATPTGTVNFVSNGTTLASAAVNTSTGVATITTTTLPTGSYSITAVYGGDTGFAASTSTAIGISILAPQFAVVGAPTALSVVAPGSVSTTFSIVPISGYVGGVDMTCSGLPANTQCNFLPATVALNGGTTGQNVQLTITTSTPPPMTVAGLMSPFGVLLLAGLWRKRKGQGLARLALAFGFVLTSGAALLTLNGCGSTSATTPAGTSTVTVMLTGSPTGTATVPVNGVGDILTSFSFTLNVH